MGDEPVEETNSGVKKKGNWSEIAEFAEEVEEALEDAEKGSLDRFEDWRPKLEESEGDLKKKTVDEATIEERKLEKKSKGIKKDFKQASDKVSEAGKKAAKKEVPEKELIEASEEVAKPFYSRMAGVLRKIESKIYSWITLRFNPYYLDTKDFSVDIKDKKNGEFEMDVAVLEEEKREDLKKNLVDEDE